jgi:hypothetical protein
MNLLAYHSKTLSPFSFLLINIFFIKKNCASRRLYDTHMHCILSRWLERFLIEHGLRFHELRVLYINPSLEDSPEFAWFFYFFLKIMFFSFRLLTFIQLEIELCCFYLYAFYIIFHYFWKWLWLAWFILFVVLYWIYFDKFLKLIFFYFFLQY